MTVTRNASIVEFDYGGFNDDETAKLKGAASEARAGGQRAVQGVFDTGRALIDARKQFDQWGRRQDGSDNAQWRTWLKQETGLSHTVAGSIIQVTRKFGSPKSGNQLPGFSVLLEISAANTPPEVVSHVLNTPGVNVHKARQARKDVTRQVESAAPLPSPKQARQIARDTGTVTMDSAKRLHFGATEKEEDDAKKLRNLIYSIREAVDVIAAIDVAPDDWFNRAKPWQFVDWNADEELERAALWLIGLSDIWKEKNNEQ